MLLIKSGRRLLPVEIKMGAAVTHYAVAGVHECMKDLGLARGWVVCSARDRRAIGRGIEIIPWEAVARGQIDFPYGSEI